MMIKPKAAMLLYALFGVLLLAFTTQVHAQKNIRKQVKIKAAFIFQMAKFVNWTLQSKSSLVFCTHHDPNSYNVLTVLTTLKAQGKLKIQGHNVRLKVLNNDYGNLDVYRECSLIYFMPKVENKVPSKVLSTLSQNKLIIGNSISFVAKGGLTALIPEKGKNKLYINRQSYENSDIRIRSRLMSLARMHPK